MTSEAMLDPGKGASTGKEDNLSSGKKLATFIMVNLALFVSYGLVSLPGSFLPLYNIDRDISISMTAVILAAVPICYIIICPLAAGMLDKWPSKHLLIINTALVAVATYIFSTLGFIQNNVLYQVACIFFRICQGLSGGVLDVIAFAVTAKLYPNNLALTTAIVETSLNMAIATAPFIGAVLYEKANFFVAFLVPAGGITVVSIMSAVAASPVDCTRDLTEDGGKKKVLTDWLIIFPFWHCAACQILLNFYIPILAPYVEEAFGEGPIFAGVALLVNTAGIIISSPFLGLFMDKFNPYLFFVLSAFVLPVVYLFLGPAPFLLGLVSPSTTQLLTVLAIIGFIMPAGCYPSLIIMLDIYKVRYRRISQSTKNLITSLYCASFPVGSCLGLLISGVMAEYLTFAESTTILGLAFILETLVLCVFCVCTLRLKRRMGNGSDEETTPLRPQIEQ